MELNYWLGNRSRKIMIPLCKANGIILRIKSRFNKN
jgi:hypothetical protein